MSNPKVPNLLSRLVYSPEHWSKSPDETQASYSRRREQVRRAQRTHRERKEKYVRSLEVEVGRLRAKDATHMQEVKSYRQTIRHLHQLLISNGIPVRDDLIHALISSPQAQISVVNTPEGHQDIHATMPDFAEFRTQSTLEDEAMPQAAATCIGLSTTSTSSHTSKSNANQPPLVQSIVPNHPLDTAQTAVDFVLALEQRCIHCHPRDPFATTEEPFGHSLMLQSSIMSHYTTQHSTRGPEPRITTLQENATWNVPALEIERLLDLSANLSLDGEITPIECWQRIKHHPQFRSLDLGRLVRLREVLAVEVKCYGFGAVVDEECFENVLHQAFAELS